MHIYIHSFEIFKRNIEWESIIYGKIIKALFQAMLDMRLVKILRFMSALSGPAAAEWAKPSRSAAALRSKGHSACGTKLSLTPYR